MTVVYNSYDGTTLGAYDGDIDSGKFYDKDGNYFGEYWGHEVFDKNGMSQGYHNGDPKASFEMLWRKSILGVF